MLDENIEPKLEPDEAPNKGEFEIGLKVDWFYCYFGASNEKPPNDGP